jgi:formate hydrogenlyase subunit 4
MYSFFHIVLILLLSPLLPGVINRVKAIVAGRRGQPMLQVYYDLWKLVQKGAAISRTTTWIFAAGPAITLAAMLAAVLLMPCGSIPSAIRFQGDLILFVYLFGVARFFTIAAAMDTGSSFEGMGASREAAFSALGEPALILALAALARETGDVSLSGIYAAVSSSLWAASGPALTLVITALFVVMLAENSRMPVDDPTTHLELTMIHEVMVLDHGGPDLALITWASSLKLWLFGSLIAGIAVPVGSTSAVTMLLAHMGGVFLVGVGVGVVESMMARIRLLRVPQLIAGAGALALIALLLSFPMR